MLKRFLSTGLVIAVLAMAGCAGGAPEAADNLTQPSTGTHTTLPSATVTPSQTAAELPTVTPTPPTTTPDANDQGHPIIIDSRGHLMVRIPAGTFVMGLTEEQAEGYCDPEWESCTPQGWPQIQMASPGHEATLTHDYWMDIYEVTNAQYQACENAGVCPPLGEVGISGFAEMYYGNPEFDTYPVVGVSWYEADTFCREWRGGRLPTEAEWEYAARGVDGRLWPWGNAEPNLNLANYLPNEGSDEWPGWGGPMPVRSFPDGVSPFGLHDVAGNVYEWVSDWYGPYPDTPLIDPTGPEEGTGRVQRGGSYVFWSIETSTVIRAFARPTSKLGGFRCVRDVSP